jgi:hypothetical protein
VEAHSDLHDPDTPRGLSHEKKRDKSMRRELIQVATEKQKAKAHPGFSAFCFLL